MFAIAVNEKGGEQKRLEFDKPEVTIGRVQGNDIILPKGNVSKRHSRIVLKDGKFIIVDLKSTNGTYVNGRKITSPLVVKGSDKIYIGDFILSIEDQQGAVVEETLAPPPPAAPARPKSPTLPPPPPRRPTVPPAATEAEAPGEPDLPDEPPAPEPARPRTATVPPAPAAAPAPIPRPSVRDPIPSSMQASPHNRPTVGPMPTRPPAAAAPVPRPASSPGPAASARPPSVARQPAAPAAPARRMVSTPAVDEAKRAKVSELMRDLSGRLWGALELGDRGPEPADEDLLARGESAASELVEQLAMDVGLPQGVEPAALARDLAAETLGAGPLGELIADESVREISVPRSDRIYVDRGAGAQLHTRWFSSPDAVTRALYRLLFRAGRMAELEQGRGDGLVEARLEGGMLLTAALPPLAARGPALSLRRPRRDAARAADLVGAGQLSQSMADFLELALRGRRNIVIAGPPGSGRSTVAGALARSVAGSERVVTVEESEELDLGDGPWIQLVSRGGHSALRGALRLRPERLVVGDVRGADALELISAMSSGLDGVLCVVQASSARDALARLSSMARLSTGAPTSEALGEQLGGAVHLIVQLARAGGDSEPRVVEIAEVVGGMPQTIFSYKNDPAGGRFAASGHVPAWADGAPPAMFRT